MTECSPYISDQSTTSLTILLTNEELEKRQAVFDISNRTEIINRFEVPPLFLEWANNLLHRLSALKEEVRRNSPERVKMRLWLGELDSVDSIEASLDGRDIHELLSPTHYLSDAPLEYYRCLLLREEMKRALTLNRKEWRRSWIYGSFFMEMLPL